VSEGGAHELAPPPDLGGDELGPLQTGGCDERRRRCEGQLEGELEAARLGVDPRGTGEPRVGDADRLARREESAAGVDRDRHDPISASITLHAPVHRATTRPGGAA
jgi:hypothetical protein